MIGVGTALKGVAIVSLALIYGGLGLYIAQDKSLPATMIFGGVLLLVFGLSAAMVLTFGPAPDDQDAPIDPDQNGGV